MTTRTDNIDVIELLEKYTQTQDWHLVHGPEEDFGTNYWYKNSKGEIVHVNMDNQYLLIESEDSSNVFYEGFVESGHCSKCG